MHTETEPQEYEGITSKPKCTEIGYFNNNMPPLKERENASRSLDENLYIKE